MPRLVFAFVRATAPERVRDEPVRANYLSPQVELLGYEVITGAATPARQI